MIKLKLNKKNLKNLSLDANVLPTKAAAQVVGGFLTSSTQVPVVMTATLTRKTRVTE
jgi:hypothetical protein